MIKRIFVKILTDPEVDLRKCVVGLACAAQAVNDGHKLDIFFASNGVKLLQTKYLESINNHLDLPDGMSMKLMKTVIEGAVNIYCSTGSQEANGVRPDNAEGILLEGWDEWMTWSGPPGVIELSINSDIQLVY